MFIEIQMKKRNTTPAGVELILSKLVAINIRSGRDRKARYYFSTHNSGNCFLRFATFGWSLTTM